MTTRRTAMLVGALLGALEVSAAASVQAGSFEDQPLFRRQGRWSRAPRDLGPQRTAPATILVFRTGGEYVEHHCWVIGDRDRGLTISPGDPHVVVVGRWRRDERGVHVTREGVARTVAFVGDVDPLCAEPVLLLDVKGSSVHGRVGAATRGRYRPAPGIDRSLESFVDEAKRSPRRCDDASRLEPPAELPP